MVITSTAVDIAQETIDAFNAGDWAKVGEFLAEDVTFKESPLNPVFRGREEVLNYWMAERIPLPDFHGRIVDVLPGDTKVGLEMVWTGTHTGAMITPYRGTFPPTGKTFTCPAFLVCIVEDGKIVNMTQYVDDLTFMAQLGLLPESFFDSV